MAAGFGPERIKFDPACVRGLEYYTGPVFEAELTFEVKDEKGNPVRFGSVGGGGRYDDLVARFTGQKVPATGFSIGVSRLQAALAHLNKDKAPAAEGPVIVTVMEKEHIADYQKLVQRLRQPDDGASRSAPSSISATPKSSASSSSMPTSAAHRASSSRARTSATPTRLRSSSRI